MDNGWVKLYRKTLDNPIIMKDAAHIAVWNYLLLNATHAEYPALFRGEKIMLQPGQLLTGRKSIAVCLKISESKVTRVLKDFENDQQIEQQTSNKNRLITIKNWALYQSSEQQTEQQVNNNRTTSEQQVNTNKNVKKIKNDKNVINTYSENPTLNNAIIEFIKYRKSIRKPMNERAVSLMLGKLNKMTSNVNEQVEILNQSILNGWAGIFPLKKDKEPKAARQEMVPSWMSKDKTDYGDIDALEKDLLGENEPDPALEERINALKERLGKEN